MPTDRARPEDLKEACVSEAFAIIAAEGLEKLSLREVARRLGVSHQAPYRHFPSRDHILAEVVARAFDHFAAYLDDRQHTPDPEQDLGGMGVAYLRYAGRHPLEYRLMFATPLPDHTQHPGMMRSARHAFTLLEQGLERMRSAQGTDCPPEVITLDALFIWSALHGLAGIQNGSAIDTLALDPRLLAEAPMHLLTRISHALAGSQPGHNCHQIA
ncbi:MAG: TetR/AcrR family transcriptional regulator [Niveispirillum sp.]|uniref:TetR/AcrR family transcriptional regulator n=1 Tax=Niveispirillum sp. TaxID=1917217 RepID=UPI003BA54CE5